MKKNLEEKIGFLTRINNRAKKSYLGYAAAAALALGGALACSEDDNSDDAGYYEDSYDDSSEDGYDEGDGFGSGANSSEDDNNGSGSSNGNSNGTSSSDNSDYGNVPFDDMGENYGSSGDSDLSASGNEDKCKLHTYELTWRLNTFCEDIPGSVDQQRNAIQAACDTWASNFTNLTCPQYIRDHPLVEAQFYSASDFDCSSGALACAVYPCSDDLFIHYNDGYTFTVDLEEAKRDSRKYDLQSVTLHEFGHIFGLGHSDDPNAVMYKYYKPLRTLTGTDIEMLRQLYQ